MVSGGWWVISNDGLLDMLRRAHAGEDPDLLYAEEYANADHDYVGPEADAPEGTP